VPAALSHTSLTLHASAGSLARTLGFTCNALPAHRHYGQQADFLGASAGVVSWSFTVGPEFVLGAVAWLGLALASALVWLTIRRPSLRIYILIVTLPGIALAAASVPGQVGLARIFGLSFMFFAVGALVLGGPLAGLYWFWRKYRAPPPGTLQ
jgi:hypothetical protein